MRLSQLLRALSSYETTNESDPDITAIAADNRQVTPGALFVAYPGVHVDGARFIPDAIQRGAVAIVAESPVTGLLTLPIIRVPDARAALAYLSAAWHNYPSRNLRVIGVTGTDGKTTTSTLIENILIAAGHTVGTVTTVAAHIGGKEIDTGFHTTTPDAPAVQKYLAQMVDAGTEYAVIESTSHGLAQHRLDAIDFDIAVVTNITHEHLDLHGSWENYRDAKALLFRSLINSNRKPRTRKVAVLNADDNSRGVFDYLSAIEADERIIYSAQPPAVSGQRSAVGDRSESPRDSQSLDGTDRRWRSVPQKEIWISAREVSHSFNGLQFSIDTPFGAFEIASPLIGRYNVSNILAAVGAAIGRRIPFEPIQKGIALTRGISGRMERIERGQPFTALVDFAHTPNALENALRTARELTPQRVIAVFGCAGLRDVQKRAWMGKVAGQFADLTVVTAEDPRTEALDVINAEIARGLESVGRRRETDYFVVNDRAEAIRFALRQLAQPGDVVIVCGKGHERSMCYGTTEYPWSDQDAVSRALET